MQSWDTVAIVGVGLIGGSIGLRLRDSGLAKRVVGIGRRSASLQAAKRAGAISEGTTQLGRGVTDAQLVVVCTPVASIVQHVREAARHCPDNALITDAGSIKVEIVAAVDGTLERGVHFVGSHPLAGSEKKGPLSARKDLFDNRLVVITPGRRTDRVAVEATQRFWRALGARVERMTPRAHDQAAAAISHLPHLVASALAAATPVKHAPLAATGWLDTTRVAAGEVELWEQILAGNRLHVLESLDKFEQQLARFRQALQREDTSEIRKLLKAGKRNRDAMGS